jgi:organic radical activating enzyme
VKLLDFPPPFRIGLILTEQCDAPCVHCWFNSSPEMGATMSQKKAEGYVDKIKQMRTVKWVSLTGGEPMLHPNLVEGLVTYSSDAGLKTELVTNCNWASSPRKALDTLRSLKDAGLDILNISADDFHQAHVPFERVKHAYVSAKELGLKMVIMCTLRKDSTRIIDIAHLLGDAIPEPGEEDHIGSAAIGVESGFTPVGRGASIPQSEWFIERSLLTGGCGSVLRDLGVTPQGELLPCCSASATLPGFTLGNLDEYDLSEALEIAWSKEIFVKLNEKGPMGLNGKTSRGLYVNKCHLCYDTLSVLQ